MKENRAGKQISERFSINKRQRTEHEKQSQSKKVVCVSRYFCSSTSKNTYKKISINLDTKKKFGALFDHFALEKK